MGNIVLGFDYHLTRTKVQESTCERDLRTDIVPRLSSKHHIRRVVKEVKYILICVRLAFKYMGMMFTKYLRLILDPNLGEHHHFAHPTRGSIWI